MKKTFVIIISILSSIFISGCGAYSQIDNLTIATAIALDLNEDGLLEFSIQLLDNNAVGNRPRDITPVIVVSETGRTIQETLRKLTTITTDKLYFSHFVLLILGEELAKEGIAPYINFLMINQETLHRYNIVVARGCKGKDVLKIVSVLEHIPAMAIDEKIHAKKEYYGISKYYTSEDVMSDIKSQCHDLTLGSIMIIGDIEEGSNLENQKDIDIKTYTKASTLAVFQNDKLVGWLDEEESIGYNYLKNEIEKSYIIVTKADGILVSVEIFDTNLKKKLIIEDGKIKYKMNISFFGEISEDLSGETYKDVEYVRDILERTKYEIKLLCEKAILKSKELNADIIGFGTEIYRKKNKVWEEIRESFKDEIFPEIEVEIIVNGEIKRVKP